MSAALSWTLIPIASAEAPSTSEQQAASPDAASDATPDSTSESRYQQLNTVPEDGLGDKAWLSGATRIVREINVKRPKEDLVICIGGCVETQDRVVFAQPAEIALKKPADAASAPDGSASTKAAVAPGDKPAVKIPDPINGPKSPAASKETQPAVGAATKSSASSEMQKPEFVPSAAQPK